MFEKISTEDNSITFFSSEFQETFHSKYGAKKEAEITYIRGCNLKEKAKYKSSLKIIDVCYGLGYNTAAALTAIWEVNPNCFVEIMALEIDQNVSIQAINNRLLNYWSPSVVNLLTQLVREKSVINKQLKALFFLDDARVSMQHLVNTNFQADAIFLDPFSPPKCPQLWSVEFINLLAKCLNSEGRIATYSCSSAIRSAFKLSDLQISQNYVCGWRSPGTIASYNTEGLTPLSPKEIEQLKTRAAIPYRDFQLNDSQDIIKQRRKIEQENSCLETTTQWKKRWRSELLNIKNKPI